MASALGRKVWWHLTEKTEPLFPNLLIFLVGRPVTGKSRAIDKAQIVMQRQGGVRMAPDTITRQWFFRRMAESMISIDYPGQSLPSIQSPYSVVNSELGTLLTRDDTEFMRALARLYDSPPTYMYETKHESGEHNDKDHIQGPCLNVLGGVQPDWIKKCLPEEAFETGFPSRVIMVQSPILQVPIIPLDEPDLGMVNDNDLAQNRLVKDLRSIGALRGRYTMTQDARRFLRDFAEGKLSRAPVHPKLETYNGRRWMHLAKLGMVVAASRSNGLVVSAGHMAQAEKWLNMAEATMPQIMAMVGNNPLKPQMDLALGLIQRRWDQGKKSTPMHLVSQALYDELHPAAWRFVIEALVSSELVEEFMGNLKPVEQK